MHGGDCAPLSNLHPPPCDSHLLRYQSTYAPPLLTLKGLPLASRLVALDKFPGVRLIGIGDMARRIINKAVLVVAHGDI